MEDHKKSVKHGGWNKVSFIGFSTAGKTGVKWAFRKQKGQHTQKPGVLTWRRHILQTVPQDPTESGRGCGRSDYARVVFTL
jgi:hypothetical protein